MTLAQQLTRGLLAFVALGSLGFFFARVIGEALLPGIALVLHLLAPDFSPELTLKPADHDHLIALSALVLRPVHIAPEHILPAGYVIPVGINLLHNLLPPVIFLALLLAMPAKSWRCRLWLMMAGSLMAVLIVAATAPFALLGHIDTYYQELARNAGYLRPFSFSQRWMIFNEIGGRYVIAIAMAWLFTRFGCMQPNQKHVP